MFFLPESDDKSTHCLSDLTVWTQITTAIRMSPQRGYFCAFSTFTKCVSFPHIYIILCLQVLFTNCLLTYQVHAIDVVHS